MGVLVPPFHSWTFEGPVPQKISLVQFFQDAFSDAEFNVGYDFAIKIGLAYIIAFPSYGCLKLILDTIKV